MTVFIGHISALQYLLAGGTVARRVFGCGNPSPPTPTRAMPAPSKTPETTIDTNLGFPENILTSRIHVNVADSSSRGRCPQMQYHVWPAPMRGSYLRIDERFCVQTPEACFAQLAGELPLPHLVELAMTLCGTFAPAPEGLPTRYNVEPLTTPVRLKAYIENLEGKRGLRNARIAARLATAGAGSPMEAKLATIFALPSCRGGYGIPALLNHEVVLTGEVRGFDHHKTRRPDFFWPKSSVALDYDGSEFHDGFDLATQDILRRNELAALGITLITARKNNVRDFLSFEALMEQLLSSMKPPYTSNARNLFNKRAQVFDAMFLPSKQFRPMDIR